MSSNDGTFKLQVNNQCVTVYGNTDYSLKNCDPNTYAQQFKTYNITNPLDAAAITGIQVDRVTDSASYPYSLVTSTINNNCLTIDNDNNISIMPCNPNSRGQQWNVSNNKNLCILNEK
jgi:hypothetical protein